MLGVFNVRRIGKSCRCRVACGGGICGIIGVGCKAVGVRDFLFRGSTHRGSRMGFLSRNNRFEFRCKHSRSRRTAEHSSGFHACKIHRCRSYYRAERELRYVRDMSSSRTNIRLWIVKHCCRHTVVVRWAIR